MPAGPSELIGCFCGADCSERTCPAGKAWFGRPGTADTAAHGALRSEEVECSAEGVCDRESGECACGSIFEGASCERLRCPSDPSGLTASCGGHGQCLTMAKLAAEAVQDCDDQYCHYGVKPTGKTDMITYGATPNDPNTWDHDMIQVGMVEWSDQARKEGR